jgi:hypothetical protein
MAPLKAKTAAEKRVFTLMEGERPLLAFEAYSFREAQSLCKEQWLRDELLALEAKAQPVWDGNSKLTIRPADESEVSCYRDLERTPDDKDPDDLVLAYLVALD